MSATLTKTCEVLKVLKAGGQVVRGARDGLLELMDASGKQVPAWQNAIRAAARIAPTAAGSGVQAGRAESGDALVEVRFLRGTCDGKAGWWCVRTGKNLDYNEIGFVQFSEQDRSGCPGRWMPERQHAANAVHMAFCDETGEGLSIPQATGKNVTKLGSYGFDGVLFRVTAKRSMTRQTRGGA